MATKAALLRKLDRRLTIVRRPGDTDPADGVEDRYGNRVDQASTNNVDDFVDCWGAAESRPTTAGEPDEFGGRDSGSTNWVLDLEPDADITRKDLVREYATADATTGVVDYTSAIVHEWQIRSVDLVTTFKGVASHWQIEATELN